LNRASSSDRAGGESARRSVGAIAGERCTVATADGVDVIPGIRRDRERIGRSRIHRGGCRADAAAGAGAAWDRDLQRGERCLNRASSSDRASGESARRGVGAITGERRTVAALDGVDGIPRARRDRERVARSRIHRGGCRADAAAGAGAAWDRDLQRRERCLNRASSSDRASGESARRGVGAITGERRTVAALDGVDVIPGIRRDREGVARSRIHRGGCRADAAAGSSTAWDGDL